MAAMLLSAVVLAALSLVSMCASQDVEREITQHRVGDFVHGRCEIQGNYAHDLDSFNVLENQQFYNSGERWGERCRNCTCSVFGAYCRGPVCDIPYDFSQDEWCIRWSEDGCCCEELGCTVDGQQYPLGSQYPYSAEQDDGHCLTCTCEIGTTKAHCLRQQCGVYNEVCENGELTVDEFCCPQYTCPSVPCTEIPDPNPDTPNHELLDWYGTINPIPVGTARHFQADTWSVYVCHCENGPVASCTMQTYK